MVPGIVPPRHLDQVMTERRRKGEDSIYREDVSAVPDLTWLTIVESGSGHVSDVGVHCS